MSLDYTAWRFWIDMAQTAATLAIGLYVWLDKRRATAIQRFCLLEAWQSEHKPIIDDLVETDGERKSGCAAHHQRTQALEINQREIQSDIRHLPSRQDMAELSRQIGGLTEKLGTLDGRLTGINRAVDLLNQHHLRINE